MTQALLVEQPQPGTMSTDTVVLSRADLEQQHRLLLAQLHLLRKVLGYPPLKTGKQRRREGGGHV